MREYSIKKLIEEYPFALEFIEQNRLDISSKEELTFEEFLKTLSEEEIEDKAINTDTLAEELYTYIEQMQEFLGLKKTDLISMLSILPGTNKSGEKEGFDRLDILPSQIVSIVGPTGSGKSRLLADIEWAAQGDTPTNRFILINDAKPDPKWRYSSTNKLVAQL